MAKKRRKVFRRQADRSWKELKPRKPKQRRKPTAKQIARAGERIVKQRELLRPLIREAAKAGATEAIEHCRNFWSISDGFKRYINHQIATEAEALMAAVRKVVAELVLVQNRRRKR